MYMLAKQLVDKVFFTGVLMQSFVDCVIMLLINKTTTPKPQAVSESVTPNLLM